MKTRIDLNSIETYYSILDELPARRRAVLEVIYDYRAHGITSFDIAEILKVGVNHVTGRVNELMHQQAIRIKSLDKSHGKPRNLYTIRWAHDPFNVFPDDLQDRINFFMGDVLNMLAADTKNYMLIDGSVAANRYLNEIIKLAEKHVVYQHKTGMV